jgi:L-lactate utilization protein LutB
MYNEASFGHAIVLNFTLGAMTEEELPSACLACGDCTELCPQDIDIPDVMKRFAEAIASLPTIGPPPSPKEAARSA